MVVDVDRVHPGHPQAGCALEGRDAPLQDGVLGRHQEVVEAPARVEGARERASSREPGTNHRDPLAEAGPVAHPRAVAVEEEVGVRPVLGVGRHERGVAVDDDLGLEVTEAPDGRPHLRSRRHVTEQGGRVARGGGDDQLIEAVTFAALVLHEERFAAPDSRDAGAEANVDPGELLAEGAHVPRHPPFDLEEAGSVARRHPFEQRVSRELADRVDRRAPARGEERIGEIRPERGGVVVLREVAVERHRIVTAGEDGRLLADQSAEREQMAQGARGERRSAPTCRGERGGRTSVRPPGTSVMETRASFQRIGTASSRRSPRK